MRQVTLLCLSLVVVSAALVPLVWSYLTPSAGAWLLGALGLAAVLSAIRARMNAELEELEEHVRAFRGLHSTL